MLRPLLKSISFLMLASCAVCAQQAGSVQQPVAPQQGDAQRAPRRIMLPPDIVRKTGVQGSGNAQAAPVQQPQGAVSNGGASKTVSNTTRTTTTTRVTKKNAKGKPVVEEVPVVQAPPPPPPTPEQLPASAPVVTYRGGLLSINSQNSTLGDILSAVKRLTGGTVEAPGTTLSERVATRLGPASPKDVLASLFSGSRFDYIILGSAQNPNGIDKIILTARQGGANPQAAGGAAPVNNRVAQAPQQQAAPPQDADMDAEEDTSPDREPVADEPAAQDQPQPENPGQTQPGAPGAPPYPAAPGAAVAPGAPTATDQQTPNETDQQNQPQQPKTPEQLLKELQDMQRQRSNPNDQPQQPQQETPR